MLLLLANPSLLFRVTPFPPPFLFPLFLSQSSFDDLFHLLTTTHASVAP